MQRSLEDLDRLIGSMLLIKALAQTHHSYNFELFVLACSGQLDNLIVEVSAGDEVTLILIGVGQRAVLIHSRLLVGIVVIREGLRLLQVDCEVT
jgi:hypothetical protein